MESNTSISLLPNELLSKKLTRIILFFAYPASVLHSCLVSPIFTVLDSDASIERIFPIILHYTIVLLDLFVFFLSYAVIIYGLCRLSFKTIRTAVILSFAAPVFKYLLKMLVSPFVDGIPTSDQFMQDLFSYIVSGTLELIQFVIVFAIAASIMKKYKLKQETLKKVSKRINAEGAYDLNVIPFNKIYDKENPLQRCALWATIVVTVARLISLAINDVNSGWILSEMNQINQYLVFFGAYIAELIIGIIGYFFMLYIFIHIYTKDSDEEN